MEEWKNISGEKYDWTKTLAPERPYIHDYTKTFTAKMYLSLPKQDRSGTIVNCTFEQALERIKLADVVSLGIRKIVYLVGWQYFGHDSKYPAWHEANEALKCPQDKTALDSLLWLIDEAEKYNTTVSLHINMQDAYDDSPLWQEYVDNDLLVKNEDGTIKEGGVWNGIQCYLISYKREWESGFAAARINELCDILPLKKLGTVHIDALHCYPDPGHGTTLEEMQEYRNRIVRYWRSIGIDVTSEFLFYETPDWHERKEQLIGLQPWCYHFSQNPDEYINRPASLVSGGIIGRRFKEGISDRMDSLFGASFDAESVWNAENSGDNFFKGFWSRFARQRFLNSLDRKRLVMEKNFMSAEFSDGVMTFLDNTITKDGAVMQKNGQLIVPVDWCDGTAALYSEEGGKAEFDVEKLFGIKTKATVLSLKPDGKTSEPYEVNLDGGILKLDTEKNTTYIIK